jgi:hypothetical protein
MIHRRSCFDLLGVMLCHLRLSALQEAGANQSSIVFNIHVRTLVGETSFFVNLRVLYFQQWPMSVEKASMYT